MEEKKCTGDQKKKKSTEHSVQPCLDTKYNTLNSVTANSEFLLVQAYYI